MTTNQLTYSILGAAYKIHSELGPGLLESAYEHCLAYELKESGLFVEIQKPLPLTYKEVRLDCGYRLDLFVNNEIVVEVKSADAIHDLHLSQTLTYLKLLKKEIGLIINFNVKNLKNGIKRVIHTQI